jgi:CheY-like chemotaxis protein
MRPVNVLLVDDDHVDRYVARRYLTRDDRIGRVLEVDDGDEAYDVLDGDSFEADLGPHPPASLVLLDINMPRMSGFELLEKLRDEGVGCRLEESVVIIVLLTSSTYFQDRAKADGIELVKAYIEKPLTAEKLDDVLVRFWNQQG